QDAPALDVRVVEPVLRPDTRTAERPRDRASRATRRRESLAPGRVPDHAAPRRDPRALDDLLLQAVRRAHPGGDDRRCVGARRDGDARGARARLSVLRRGRRVERTLQGRVAVASRRRLAYKRPLTADARASARRHAVCGLVPGVVVCLSWYAPPKMLVSLR